MYKINLSFPMSQLGNLLFGDGFTSSSETLVTVLKKYNLGNNRPKQSLNESQHQKIVNEIKKTALFAEYTTTLKISQELKYRGQQLVQQTCKMFGVPFRFHRSLLSKCRGYHLESKVCSLVSPTITKPDLVYLYIDLESCKLTRTEPKNAHCRFVGQADGIDELFVYEIKTRVYNKQLKLSEVLQISLYCIGYDRPNCKLVQLVNGELITKTFTRKSCEEFVNKHMQKLVHLLRFWSCFDIDEIRNLTSTKYF